MSIVPRTWKIDFELEIMDKYLHNLYDYFETQRRELVEQIERMAKGLNYEESHDLYESFEDELSPLNEDFPRLFHSGFVISWYSFLETSLLLLCNEFKLRIEISARDRPISDTGIFRARKFLKEAAKYEIDTSHWQELLLINYVRNKLVHERGIIPAYSSKIDGENKNYESIFVIKEVPYFVEMEHNQFEYIQRFAPLSYKGASFAIAPSMDFCIHLVGFARVMLHKIYDDLDKTIK